MEASLARQRASIDRQMEGVRKHFPARKPLPPLLPAAQADCEPLKETELAPLVASAATAHQLKPELLRAVIRQESGARACAVSPKGAMGLMQLMPETAEQFRLADPFDPAQNVQTGAQYLKQLLDRFDGDLKLALAAYNAGPGRVGASPPAVPDIPETRNYVEQILKALTPRP
jgi:soluble lytic murein transglycosylase-like protein